MNNNMFSRSSKTGVTLVELLVALAIASIFLTGVITAFVQILRASNISEVKVQAATNASTALRLMTKDIKKTSILNPQEIFQGTLVELGYGDNIDNDGDGKIDEETINGKDDDGDFVDNHAKIGSLFERGEFVGIADLGDIGVDEDAKFRSDSLLFYVNDTLTSISFEIGDFEGESNVLLKKTLKNDDLTTAPVAFEVLSLAFLYWDFYADPKTWIRAWNSEDILEDIKLPATVFISISVYAGEIPFKEFIKNYIPGQTKIDTITMQTVVNIEDVLKHTGYQ